MRMTRTALVTATLGFIAAPLLASATVPPASGAEDSTDDTVFVSADSTTPPGTKAVEGSNGVKVGTTPKKVQEILDMSPAHRARMRIFDGETPEHRVKIAPFFMGTYEVTNEQYKAFVDATNRRPPEHWFGDALRQAQRDFLENEGLKAKQAKEEARNYKRREWDELAKDQWVEANWQTAPWSIPEGTEQHGVSYVDFNDARAYAEWAGLRLPTEDEWVYAARGAQQQEFPWGDEWNAAGRAHTAELRSGVFRPVGSFPEGKSPFGVLDLSGGLWEWTSSPYTAFPRFKANEYKVVETGKRKPVKKRAESRFNGAERVVKGGSLANPMFAARVNYRQGVIVSQTTAAIGFRVASSGTPGLDRARALWSSVIRPSSARKDDAGMAFDRTVGMDRWTEKAAEGSKLESYGVIEDYESVMFIPRDDLALKGAKLNSTSRVWPVTFGVLQTSIPLAKPALEPGVYFVLYRGQGKFLDDPDAAEKADDAAAGEEGGEAAEAGPDDKGELTPEQQMLESIDVRKNLLVFVDAKTGEYKASIETSKPADKQISKIDTGITHVIRKIWEGERAADKVRVEQDWLSFEVAVPMGTKRAIPLAFDVMVAKGALGRGWRR